MGGYEYTIEQCDVPEVRRGNLAEYRKFRTTCLDYLRGDRDTSVITQVHSLAWFTAVFRTLNEARRLEPDRKVSGPLWELTSTGYASLITLGVRKLVDNHPQANSIWNVVAKIENCQRNGALITRENFVCFDGLPFDPEPGKRSHAEVARDGKLYRLPTKGREAWGMSQIVHEWFDRMCGHPVKRRRCDMFDLSILERVKKQLQHPTIKKVCTFADKRVAHAERIERADALPTATFDEVDEALRLIVRAVDFVSLSVFYDTSIGSVVPMPQFDILEGLDAPWITPDNKPAMDHVWNQVKERMDDWIKNPETDFLE